MIVPILIFSATCLAVILSILFLPTISLFGKKINTYWFVALLGGILTVLFGGMSPIDIGKELIADSAINPLKILVLFLSMTALSIVLDELGFFRYLAGKIAERAKSDQRKIFLLFYLLVSILTIFTSNDVIILSFTPFLCYFARNAGINPIPYLVAEFFAANTWSMIFVIGNPTNIYLATAFEIDFLSYLKVSLLPTFAAGILSFLLLLLLFGKELKKPFRYRGSTATLENKPAIVIGVAHLAVCTILLAVGSYIRLEMWLISLISAVSLFLCSLILCAIQRKKTDFLLRTLKRLPYPIVPFILSMFVMIVVLDHSGVTAKIALFLGNSLPVLQYGTLSFFASNLLNNIPMSVLFTSLLGNLSGDVLPAVYATVIGSNLGALFTPIGSLAGIMWSSMLAVHGVKFGYTQFLKVGLLVALPSLAAALGALCLVFAF